MLAAGGRRGHIFISSVSPLSFFFLPFSEMVQNDPQLLTSLNHNTKHGRFMKAKP